MYEEREFEKGIGLVLLSTQLFPSSSKTWANLAWVYEESGDTKSAIKYYKKAIELNPDDNYSKQELQRLLK